MNALIPDIETLKKVVKINSSLPYESIEPYIEDALDIYVKPYVGQSVIKQALTDQGSRSVMYKDNVPRPVIQK